MAILEKEAAGLLLAMMEPPTAIEEEFQRWYDYEHFPERAAIEGFASAARFVCLDGWPRYMAVYDLASLGVLEEEAYQSISGRSGYSPWTRHIVGRVWGQYRSEAIQLYPGNARLGDGGRFSRLALWRFSALPSASAPGLLEGLRELYEKQPETAQIRLFRTVGDGDMDHLALVELRAPWTPPSGAVAVLGDVLPHLDLVNVYAPYERVRGSSFPHRA